MLEIIFLLVFGLGVGLLVWQNNSVVTITILGYLFHDVPLFAVIVGSIILGALMVYIIHLINSISTAFFIHGKDKKIKETEKSITELTKKIHQLQLENEALRSGDPPEETDGKAL